MIFPVAYFPASVLAMAGAPGGNAGSGPGQLAALLLPIGLTVLIFYLLLLRPEQRRQRQHQEMLGQMKKGDQVVTTGGIIGRVSDLSDQVVTIDVGNRIKIKILRSAIRDVGELPENSAK